MTHRRSLKNMPSINQALASISSRWEIAPLTEHKPPVFILSAGWRSGSTLLQRIVLSGENILVWGEPYAHSDYIRKMADSLRIFQNDLPRDQFFIDHYQPDEESSQSLSDLWVANLYPMPSDLIDAHRQFFIRLYETPAINSGYQRWGLKEVRLSIDYAQYLKFLFPDAKFLFLYRNPYDAYQSYRSFRAWYDVWPTSPVFTPTDFAKIWKKLLDSFISQHQSLDGKLIKYEDLITGNLDLSELSGYLGFPVRKETIETTVTGGRASKKTELSSLEKKLIQRVVEPTASQQGYYL
ncbi:MAG: sulfotransferase [Candidatus Thiodiazotropha sp.]